MKRNLKLTVGTWIIEVEQSAERKSKDTGNIITIYQKDAMTSDSPIQYQDGRIAYNYPHIVPQYVKDFLNDNMWELYNVNLQPDPCPQEMKKGILDVDDRFVLKNTAFELKAIQQALNNYDYKSYWIRHDYRGEIVEAYGSDMHMPNSEDHLYPIHVG